MTVTTGLTGQLSFEVTDADTATALGSGDVPVLATPRVLAWLEAATLAALDGQLEPGLTTVGSRVELIHERPTPVGTTVTCTAEVCYVEGRVVRFVASAEFVTAAGTTASAASAEITRVIVDRERFLAKLG